MATKLPSGNWRVLVYSGKDQNGKRKYESFTAPTKREVEFIAAEWARTNNNKTRPDKITLRNAAAEYIAQRDGVLSPSTIYGYKKICAQYFQDIMDLPLSSINEIVLQKSIQTECNRVSKFTNNKLSPKTIRSAFAFISGVLDGQGVTINTKKIRLPQKEKIKYNTPNGEILSKIFAATYNTPIEIPVLLASWLTLRMSEICALKWENIYDDYIQINSAKIYLPGGEIEKTTKTEGSARNILLPKYIKERLNHVERKSEYVVNLSGQAIGKRFTRILEKNNIPHCRFHDLRHTAASIMLLLNIPDKYAMSRGGWSTDHIYKQTYQNLFEEEEIIFANKIDLYYDGIIKTMQHEMQHNIK